MSLVEKQRWCSWYAKAVWFAASVGGSLLLLHYKATPGPTTQPPRHWPLAASLVRSEAAPTLLMFAHPLCPCTRASLNELAVIMSSSRIAFPTVHVIFRVPESLPADWVESKLVAQAQDINGVEVIWDQNGSVTAQFGIKTSGHVLLYDEDGTLAFSGGITGLRGHEGDNPGRETVISFAWNRSRNHSTSPVFGCPLIGHQAVACRSPSGNAP